MRIWHGLDLALALLELSLGSVWERKTLTGVRIWHGLDLALTLFEPSLGSAWERQTLTGVRIWHGLDLAFVLFGLILGSVWERKTLTEIHMLTQEREERAERGRGGKRTVEEDGRVVMKTRTHTQRWWEKHTKLLRIDAITSNNKRNRSDAFPRKQKHRKR